MKMSRYIFYPANRSAVLCACCEALKQKGYGVVDRPCESVTHLLLPVPSFQEDGSIKGGGDLQALLEKLPPSVRVWGTGMPNLLKGSFSVEGYGMATLCLNPQETPILMLQTADGSEHPERTNCEINSFFHNLECFKGFNVHLPRRSWSRVYQPFSVIPSFYPLSVIPSVVEESLRHAACATGRIHEMSRLRST